MKKYSGYYKALVLVLLLTFPGMLLSFKIESSALAAMMCTVAFIVTLALRLMPDSDKYKSV
jgi:hypothetical protein